MLEHAKFVLLLACLTEVIYGQDFMCCAHTSGGCRAVCEEISLVEIAADEEICKRTITEVEKVCPKQLTNFWECLNATFYELSRGDAWSGRACCSRTYSESCRKTCLTATRKEDLYQGCRPSDEISFFVCVDWQNQGEICCRNTEDASCRDVCLNIFKSRVTPTLQHRTLLAQVCNNSSAQVATCVQKFVRLTPIANLHKYANCCEKSAKVECRDACRSALTTNNSLQEMLDTMQFGGCGPPLLHDPIYQCFMHPPEGLQTEKTKTSRIDRVGMDSAKLHCCEKATTNECRRLCTKTFAKDWASYWVQLNMKCLSSIAQDELRTCLDEVDEPCQLGCDGLSFCTNFNNRPTELFRSCTPIADEVARQDVLLWQNHKELVLPGVTLPLKNISNCSPSMWKAVACTLQIKPCSRHSHANQICPDVCLDIITECVDWTQTPLVHSPDSICAMLSPENTTAPCVSLLQFLAPSDLGNYSTMKGEITAPCKNQPCDVNDTCLVNRNCEPGQACMPYSCVPGCKMGEVSRHVVPEGTWVRIPVPNNKGCVKYCQCARNRIDQCQPMVCEPQSGCWMGSNKPKHHGEMFEMECQKCVCFAGEVICSPKQCHTSLEGHVALHTTLPCNCPLHYIPVCGQNGQIYPSACVAKCVGLSETDIAYGSCQDPCQQNPCGVGKKCVPDLKVCLSLAQKPCMQFQCINGSTRCPNSSTQPVCDVENNEHGNACLLAHSNKKLAYRGRCRTNCRSNGVVCSISGRTYISECAAHADYVSVDYLGPCSTWAFSIAPSKSAACANVHCLPLPVLNCAGVIPAGACCPVCGGILRVLYSQKQIDRSLNTMRQKSEAFTLIAVLSALERLVHVAQCTLRGFRTIEQDIFIVVQSTERHPSQVQLEACVREAEKLASLINRRSPRIVSELSLSPLMWADLVYAERTSSAQLMISDSVFMYIMLCALFARTLFAANA